MFVEQPVITSVNYNREKFLDDLSFEKASDPDRQNYLDQIRNITGGLADVSMDRLSRVVVVAGPNGSGKTRTLRLISYAIDRANNFWPSGAPPSRNVQGRIDHTLQTVVSVKSGPKPSRVDIASTPQTINLVQGATRGDLRAAATQLEGDAGNFGANFQRAATMTQRCFDEYWNSAHQESRLPDFQKTFLRDRWQRLCKLVSDLLKKQITVDDSQMIHIDGVEIDQALGFFSEGERRLFGLAASLVGQDSNQLRRVILCDEPENHLHPEAAVQVLTAVRDALPTSQLWIATHSVTVIAALGWENVWVANSGRISFSGRDTSRIVTSLLGGTENVARLRAFMDEPDKAAMAKFASECLSAPTSAPYNRSDPQIGLAAERVTASTARSRILDWGAGNGRFVHWLRGRPSEEVARIDYFALEPHEESQRRCLPQIQALYDDPLQRLFSSPTDAINYSSSQGKFDTVILANVLHEISVDNWPPLFAQIGQVLDQKGQLLILEDADMRVGELPTDEGFLLLTPTACALLFKDHQRLIVQHQSQEPKYADRLMCFAIPQNLLFNVTLKTAKSAIEEIASHSLTQIAAIRATGRSGYDIGNRHALHLALYANAGLALKRLAAEEDTSNEDAATQRASQSRPSSLPAPPRPATTPAAAPNPPAPAS